MENLEIEQAYSEYHKTVTKLQLDHEQEKEDTRKENRLECDKYIDMHLEESAGEIYDKFTDILNKDLEELRDQVKMLIDIEKGRLQAKIQFILRHL